MECWDAYLENNYSPEIKIGSGVVINYNVHIGAINKIVIGDNVLIGSNVLITDHMHGNISDNLISVPIKNKPLISRGPVFIEDNVWIGENVCILDNVRIGNRG